MKEGQKKELECVCVWSFVYVKKQYRRMLTVKLMRFFIDTKIEYYNNNPSIVTMCE